jgi:hypothetical protein
MSVAVYPRLGALLKERHLTVVELERQIAKRFGLDVDQTSLDQWAHGAPVQRADLELAGAAAAVLEVSLGDLFEIDLGPDLPDEGSVLDAASVERLSELLEQQQSRELSGAEEAELASLVAEYGRQRQERGLTTIAAQRGISVDQARRDLQAELDRALEWWEAFKADPVRWEAAVTDLKRRNRRASPRT